MGKATQKYATALKKAIQEESAAYDAAVDKRVELLDLVNNDKLDADAKDKLLKKLEQETKKADQVSGKTSKKREKAAMDFKAFLEAKKNNKPLYELKKFLAKLLK